MDFFIRFGKVPSMGDIFYTGLKFGKKDRNHIYIDTIMILHVN